MGTEKRGWIEVPLWEKQGFGDKSEMIPKFQAQPTEWLVMPPKKKGTASRRADSRVEMIVLR